MNIFEECKYDRYIFEEKHPVLLELTVDELKYIQVLFNFLRQLKPEETIGIGNAPEMTTFFKIHSNQWVVWEADERRGFSNATLFDSIHDACSDLIRRGMEGNVSDLEINSIMGELTASMDTVDTRELQESLECLNYTIVPSKSKTLNKIKFDK